MTILLIGGGSTTVLYCNSSVEREKTNSPETLQFSIVLGTSCCIVVVAVLVVV